MTTLAIDQAINKYAVYNGTSDAPLTDPMNNLPNLLWHSDLKYIGAQTVITGTVNLDPSTSGWVGTPGFVIGVGGAQIPTTVYPYTITLHTHGLSYAPFFLGWIQIGTEKVPINGSFLYGRHSYNVYSDATGIHLTCDQLAGGASSNLSCSFSVAVLNAGTASDGSMVDPPFFSGFDATDTRMQCGYFDTTNRYIIKIDAGDVRVHTGATISVELAQPKYTSSTCVGTCVVFKSGNYVHTDIAYTGQSTAFAAPSYNIALK